uniref:hypothetical protein n=1 Tax=Roseburia intestinalis TaxID=166486 RepID=UPI001A9C0FEF
TILKERKYVIINFLIIIQGLNMKILKSILNYIPLATFIIFVVTDGIMSLTSALIFVISTIGLLINWKRKKPAMKN